MASNHGFADGNKRTTLILLHNFVQNSGYRLVAANEEDLERAVEDIILAAASSNTSIQQLMDWFEPRIERASKRAIVPASLG
jgi:prophage maintenance system killer protein